MNTLALNLGLKALMALSNLQQSDAYAALKADIAAFNAKVREQLPAKADGTPWTEDDVLAAAAKLEDTLDQIDSQHRTTTSNSLAGPGGTP